MLKILKKSGVFSMIVFSINYSLQMWNIDYRVNFNLQMWNIDQRWYNYSLRSVNYSWLWNYV